MSIFLAESSANFKNFFRESKKRKALTMQLALCSNDIKIYCGWRVTFKATQSYINLIISYNYHFCVYSILVLFYSYDSDELIKIVQIKMTIIKETRNTICMHIYIVLIIMLIHVWGSHGKCHCTVCTRLPMLKISSS